MLEPACEFCTELNGENSPLLGKSNSRIVATAGRIRCFPSLGEMIPGHTLISPIYHVTSSLILDASDYIDLRKIVSLVTQAFQREYQQTHVFFEHGDPTGKEINYGQCVSHAHIHALPRAVDMLSIVRSSYRELISSRLGQPNAEVDEPYLMISQDGEMAHFFSAQNAPRQYLRKVFSDLIGKPDAWEWYKTADAQTTLASVKKLRQVLGDGAA